MKKLLIIFVALVATVPASAKVAGIASEVALLQQLQLSLGLNIDQMDLPQSLLDKLPVTTAIEEIKPSFLSSWTQITYLGCSEAIRRNRLDTQTEPEKTREWIREFATTAWGMSPTDKEVEEAYEAGFFAGSKEAAERKTAITCALILSSPKVYVVTTEGQ